MNDWTEDKKSMNEYIDSHFTAAERRVAWLQRAARFIARMSLAVVFIAAVVFVLWKVIGG